MKRAYTFGFALLLAMVVIALPTQARAATEGPFVYEIEDGKAVIISCSQSVSGELAIPATLGGCPVTGIGRLAFDGCVGLSSITLPESVTSIDWCAFNGCTSLEFTVYDNARYLGSRENPHHALISATNQSIESCQIAPGTHILATNAFYGCERLTSITIPDGVASIGDSAFGKCTGLTSIAIPEGVTRIESCTFQDCSGLSSITVPSSVTSIGQQAFNRCTGLTSIAIPNSVTSVESLAFGGCTGLTSITIPSSVTRIESAAFGGCSGLTTVDIPNSVTSIGFAAFRNCTGLTSITIPEGVTIIERYAFEKCTELTNLTIPTSVIRIEGYAFSECFGLNNVYFNGSSQQWNNITIDSDNNFLLSASLHFASKCDNGHHWNEGKVAKIATCKETGVKIYTCTVCNETKTEPIAKLTTHTPGEAATETTDQVCTVCGEVLAPATGGGSTPTDAPDEPADATESIEIQTQPSTQPTSSEPAEPPIASADGSDEDSSEGRVIVIAAIMCAAGSVVGVIVGIVVGKKKF